MASISQIFRKALIACQAVAIDPPRHRSNATDRAHTNSLGLLQVGTVLFASATQSPVLQPGLPATVHYFTTFEVYLGLYQRRLHPSHERRASLFALLVSLFV